MTILLFLTNASPFFVLDSDMNPAELTASINANQWQPPAEFVHWLSGKRQDHSSNRLCASLHDNLVIISPSVIDHPSNQNVHSIPRFTRRQREVLQGVFDGKTSRQIASQLGIRPRTVAWHINQLKKLLGAQTLTQSVARMLILDNPVNPKIER